MLQRGLIESGNIDVTKQPSVKNPDGSISTVDSISINSDGREVLLPRVTPDGRHLTTDQAIAEYQRTGRHLGKFDSPESANTFAQALHRSEAQRIGVLPDSNPKSDGMRVESDLNNRRRSLARLLMMGFTPAPGFRQDINLPLEKVIK